jgi:hypothetical protein
MTKSSTTRLSPICHLPVRSTWQATVLSLGRIRGPRAFGALASLMLAGILSLFTCLKVGKANSVAQARKGTVLLLAYSKV